eukprot:TRINITY_DN15279_c0_g1_i1.p1 TRINITY_DN15279_c0_g1~~TRINITY_DN15279_c0_g1_i1.p1  ORF type:complete len:1384 (-),score=254.75 TRINITY_DN15279_c0_g1_i1:166-3972(-)
MVYEVQLPEADLEHMTALDLSIEGDFLAVACEDALVIVVPLLEFVCLRTPSWSPLAKQFGAQREKRRQQESGEKAGLEGAFSSVASAWTAMGLGGGEMLSDLFGGSSCSQAETSPMRFHVPSIRQEGDAITSMTWWTRNCIEPHGTDMETDDATHLLHLARQKHYLILASLSGRLAIMDVRHHVEVRSFSLAPIVWLQQCRSHCQEYLLIETTAEPKHWKLLLAATIEPPVPRPGLEAVHQRPVTWSITDGQALPTASSEHFELEPLSGLPELYQLLVFRRGHGPENGSETPGACSRSDGGSGNSEEVLGLLVDDKRMLEAQLLAETEKPLCLLLSLPSFPEEPLARIDLPVAAAPPGAPGRRRLADLVMLLGGGLLLSILHVAGEPKGRDAPGCDQSSLVVLTTAKPRPCMVEGGSEANKVVQELRVPGRVVGAAPGYGSWSRTDNLLGVEGGAEEDRVGADWQGWTTLAVVWTLSAVFVLTSSASTVCETLQLQIIEALTPGRPVLEPIEVLLPLLCWSLDIDIDALLLDAGRRAITGNWAEVGEQNLRTALALWARRSTRVVPLEAILEGFGELVQHVDVVCNVAPAILQVLMPHWPRIASQMAVMHCELRGANGEVRDEDDDDDDDAMPVLDPSDVATCVPFIAAEPVSSSVLARKPSTELHPKYFNAAEVHSPTSSPGQETLAEASSVAWFLSLVVMLLVLLHPRGGVKPGSSEYTRRGRGTQSAAENRLEWTSAQQAWVSDQVTLMLSGARGTPSNSFAQMADAVQQDFDTWLNEQLQEDQSASLWVAGRLPQMPDSGLSKNTSQTAESSILKSSLVDARGQDGFASVRASHAEAAEEIVNATHADMEELQHAIFPGCYSARFLLLCATLRCMPPQSESDEIVDLRCLLCQAACLAQGAGPVAASMLVTLLFRGMRLSVLSVEAGSRSRHYGELHASPDLGVIAACSLLELSMDYCYGPELAHRVLWAMLKAVSVSTNLHQGHAAGAVWTTLCSKGCEDEDCKLFAQMSSTGSLAAAMPMTTSPEVRSTEKPVSWRSPLPRTVDRQSTWLEWCEMLSAVGQLYEEARVFTQCTSTWSWQMEGNQQVSLSISDPLSAEAVAEVRPPILSTGSIVALHALEAWLLENSPVNGDPAGSRENQADPETQTSHNLASQDFFDLAARGAVWEDAVKDSFAAAGERFVRAQWWQRLLEKSPASMVSLELAVMAAENPWVWELPWTGRFRLHLAQALLLIREKVDGPCVPDRSSEDQRSGYGPLATSCAS